MPNTNVFFDLLIFYLICIKSDFSQSNNEIILTIKGKGTQQILSNKSHYYEGIKFDIKPSEISEIFVNGNKTEIIDIYVYNLTEEENTIKIIFNKKLENCNAMFNELSNITYISFNNFDSSQVKSARFMFNGCFNLKSLDLSNLDTSSITYMRGMFQDCSNLTSLNLSNFNTSKVIEMVWMFRGCSNLTSLDLRNFNTQAVAGMGSMFEGCSKLISLDLSHFNTERVTGMSMMFYKCSNLLFLDLGNFNTASSKFFDNMFSGCKNLISLDLSNFNTSLASYMGGMFSDCSNLISLDLRNFDTTSATYDSSTINMFKNCKSDLIICINNSTSNSKLRFELDNYNFTYSNNCSDICFYNEKKLIFETKKCELNCTDNNNLNYKGICYSKCPDGTHQIFDNICEDDNDNYNIYTFSSTPIIDNITNNIKEEYSYSNNIYSEIISYNTNNNNENSYDFYSTNINDITISINNNNEYSFINSSFQETFWNYIDYFDTIIGDKNNSNDILTIIKNAFKKGKLDLFILNIMEKDKNDIFFEKNNVIYQLTSLYNYYNNLNNNNLSSINFGKCEIKLKEYYNISSNNSLLILKIDIYEKKILIPFIYYEVYNIKTKEQLDLNLCKFEKIDINIPVNINENKLFKYNSSGKYYNDICSSYTTEKNTDIILEDRRNEYINDNLFLCEKNCKYKGYNSLTKKVLCECFVKINIPLISSIEINKDKLIKNFIDIKSTTNINIMKCYYILFTKKGIIKNIGHYITMTMILCIIILNIIFILKGYDQLKFQVNEILKNKKKDNEEKTIKINNNPPKTKIGINVLKTKDELNGESNSKFESKNFLNIRDIKKEKKDNLDLNNTDKKQNILLINSNVLNNKSINYNDYELNNLSFQNALKSDKRGYFQYYFSLLKTKQTILFTFYNKADYNSKIIKIILFIFSFSLFFTINALFFDDATLHKIYEDQGRFNFIYQIPKILYSTIITILISLIIKYFSLSERDIIKFKSENKDINEKYTKLLKCLFIKLILFFAFVYIFIIFFWYYLSCFCAVYQNTQIYLLKDTLISFSLSLVYPFALNLLPGLLRIPALKHNNESLYIFSKLVQLI